jgi:proteasome lid subunit RPN8/RPN11
MMQYRLHLSENNLQRLEHHAEKGLPDESVALLFGNIIKNDIQVGRTVTLSNTASASGTSFSIDPETQYRLYVEAEERGETLVCIFHSHPAPPYPSPRDLDNMRLNPVVWLIASKTTGNWVYKAYILEQGKPVEIPIIEGL